MSILFEKRLSDSPYLETVTRRQVKDNQLGNVHGALCTFPSWLRVTLISSRRRSRYTSGYVFGNGHVANTG